jgi:hypothetical protein
VTVTKTVVVDTNVLLSNPEIIRELDGADVVIPETVLSELDKLKTARVDADLRFKGREVSRNLFELSEQGLLAEGVALPGGGELRVVPFDLVGEMPEELSSRNADDRIVAVAYDLMKHSEDDVYLLTADLNMLLKAQSLGIPVQRFRTEDEQSVARRYVIRPFQRYRVPLTILAIAVAVFAGIVYVAQLASRPGASASIPVEFSDQLAPQQQQILTYLLALQENPSDMDTAKKLGDLYFELWSDPNTRAPIYAIDAIKHYRLAIAPGRPRCAHGPRVDLLLQQPGRRRDQGDAARPPVRPGQDPGQLQPRPDVLEGPTGLQGGGRAVREGHTAHQRRRPDRSGHKPDGAREPLPDRHRGGGGGYEDQAEHPGDAHFHAGAREHERDAIGELTASGGPSRPARRYKRGPTLSWRS